LKGFFPPVPVYQHVPSGGGGRFSGTDGDNGYYDI
jgi:hypothetical protein